jgi:hypothetical protein
VFIVTSEFRLNRLPRLTQRSAGSNQARGGSTVEHHEPVYVFRVRDMVLAAHILSDALMHVLDFPWISRDFLVKFAFQ